VSLFTNIDLSFALRRRIVRPAGGLRRRGAPASPEPPRQVDEYYRVLRRIKHRDRGHAGRVFPLERIP
jgi:hypothetical protein